MPLELATESIQNVYPIFCQSWSSAHVLQWLGDLQNEMHQTEWGSEDRARVWPMFLKKNAETWGIKPFWLDVLSFEWALHLVKNHPFSYFEAAQWLRLNPNAQVLQQRYNVPNWIARGAKPQDIPEVVDPTLLVLFKRGQSDEISELILNPTQALILDEIIEGVHPTLQTLAYHLKDLVGEAVWMGTLMDLKERGLVI